MKRFEVQAGSPAVVRYVLVQEDDETFLVPEDVEAVVYHVYDLDTEEALTPEGGAEVAVEDFLFAEPQPWSVNDEGYNARVEVAADYLPTGGKTYRLEVLLTPVSGSPRYLEHVELVAVKTLSA